jgi:hypothetical protein
MRQAGDTLGKLDHSLVTNVVLVKVKAQSLEVWQLIEQIASNFSSIGSHTVNTTTEIKFLKLRQVSQPINNILKAEITEVFRGNSEVQCVHGLQVAQKSAQCLSTLVFNVVEVQIEVECFEAALDLLDAVTNGLCSNLCDIVEIQINIKLVQILLGLQCLCNNLCALCSEFVSVEVEVQAFKIGP